MLKGIEKPNRTKQGKRRISQKAKKVAKLDVVILKRSQIIYGHLHTPRPEKDAELAEDIAKNGLREPLIVREYKPNCYQIVDGNHRLRALDKLKRSQIPCVVLTEPNQKPRPRR